MALKEYEVEINGLVHTVQLSEHDAEVRGLKSVKPAENKMRVPRNKATRPADKALSSVEDATDPDASE